MSSEGGRVGEVVAYESLDLNGSKFFFLLFLLTHAPMLRQCFIHVKVNFEEKYPIIPFEKFPFLVLARNTIMLPHLIIHSSIHYMLTGRLREVKKKGKFQTFSYKSGRGRLRKVVPNKRFQM